MASVEAGPSAATGAVSKLLTPTGGGNTPTSQAAMFEGPTLTSSGVADAQDYGPTILAGSGLGGNVGAVAGSITKYLMIGEDNVLNGVYGVWQVMSSPDYAGAQAGSASPAIALPARNVSVLG